MYSIAKYALRGETILPRDFQSILTLELRERLIFVLELKTIDRYTAAGQVEEGFNFSKGMGVREICIYALKGD